MTLRNRTLLRSSLIAATLAVSAPLAAQSVLNFGYLPGDQFGQANSVSHDGSVVIGTTGIEFFDHCRAVRRTPAGLQELVSLPGTVNSFAAAVSQDGRVVVGSGYGANTVAWRWTPALGMQDLGALPGAAFGAEAYGVNGNGNVVVGVSDSPTGYRAFRWTPALGMQDLGFLPGGSYAFATGVSSSGNVVVGFANIATWEQGFRWTPGQGMGELPSLDPNYSSNAFGVSANGNVAFGYSGPSPVRWVGNGAAQDLGLLPGGTFGAAYCSNATGTMIGGFCDDAVGGYPATLWTPALGMVVLADLLEALDIDTTGWDFEVLAGISADGTTLVGPGRYLGQEAGFIVRLPCAGNGWHGSVHHHGNHGHHAPHGPHSGHQGN